jgi:hypothetical protein
MGDMSTVHAGTDHQAARWLPRLAMTAVAIVALWAAVSEGAVALGVVGLHSSSGDVDLRGLAVFAAAVTLFFAGPVLAVAAATPFADLLRPGLPGAALVTAAAVVARFYAYDSYYFPLHRRMSDGGILPGWWIVLVAGLAVAAAALAFRNARAALLAGGAAMFLAGPTIFVAALGH